MSEATAKRRVKLAHPQAKAYKSSLNDFWCICGCGESICRISDGSRTAGEAWLKAATRLP